MTGFSTLKILRKFEQDVDELGLCIREAKNYGDSRWFIAQHFGVEE